MKQQKQQRRNKDSTIGGRRRSYGSSCYCHHSKRKKLMLHLLICLCISKSSMLFINLPTIVTKAFPKQTVMFNNTSCLHKVMMCFQNSNCHPIIHLALVIALCIHSTSYSNINVIFRSIYYKVQFKLLDAF